MVTATVTATAIATDGNCDCIMISLDKFVFGICITLYTDNQFNSTMQLNQLKTINLYYSNVYFAGPTMTYCACTVHCTNISSSSELNGPTTLSYLQAEKLFRMQLYFLAYAYACKHIHSDIVNSSITVRSRVNHQQ